MDTKEYFEIYSVIINVFEKNNPKDMFDLFSELHDTDFIQSRLKNGFPPKELSKFTLDTVDNLLSDGLIKAKKITTKSGPIYMFDGMTTEGRKFLLNTNNKSSQFVEYVRDNGIPLDPTSISKAVINFLYFVFRKKPQQNLS